MIHGILVAFTVFMFCGKHTHESLSALFRAVPDSILDVAVREIETYHLIVYLLPVRPGSFRPLPPVVDMSQHKSLC